MRVASAGSLAVLQAVGGNRISLTYYFRTSSIFDLLESGVDINVIRGWLGHASLETTNRYAELTLRAKEAAMRATVRAILAHFGGRPPSSSLEERVLSAEL